VVRYFKEASKQANAWVESEADIVPRPQPGDIVLVGEKLAEHVCICIGWIGDIGNDCMISVDGGQVEPKKGLQAIRQCQRPWYLSQGQVFLGHKPVKGWLSMALCPMGPTITVPEGWKSVEV
jgi:hypothetical protein